MTMEYRLSCEYKTDLAKQKGYKNSYEVTNETTSQLLAQCDVVGYVSHDAIAVKDDLGGISTLSPNRKIMPNVWTLADTQKIPLYTFTRISFTKTLNPFGREIMTITDNRAARTFNLRNTTESTVDLLLGTASRDWVLFEGDTPVAYLEKRKDPKTPVPKNKILASLKRLIQSADWVLVSTTNSAPLSASGYLIMMLLFEELTKNTG